MEEKKTNDLPNNPIEAQGMLIKSFYETFGKDALPIIKDICAKQGKSLGLKIKKKLPNNKLSAVAKAFSKSYDPKDIEVVSISDNQFHIRGTKCPFGLEDTSRELCEAVMQIDREYFCTAVSKNIKLKIISTVAEGAPRCDTKYELEKQ
jgi:hypothetical protein